MAEVEQSVSVRLGLGDVEVRANQRNENRVEDVENELVQ